MELDGTQIEALARALCAVRSLDPDQIVYSEGRHVPRWHLARLTACEFLAMLNALVALELKTDGG